MILEYPYDALSAQIVNIAESHFEIGHNQERIVIFMNKNGSTLILEPNCGMNTIENIKSYKIMIYPRFINTKIVTVGSTTEMTIDITDKVSNIISSYFEGNICILKDYYTLFATEDELNPRPLDPRKPLNFSTLKFDRFILQRYLFIFPPHLMTELEPSMMMFYDCRRYIYEHNELEIDNSLLILLTVFDTYALDEDSLTNGTFDLSKYIPPYAQFSYVLNDEVLQVAKTVRSKDKIHILQNYVKLARKIHNFGETKYQIPDSNMFVTIDPYGVTFYNDNKEKIGLKILFPNITEIKLDKTVIHLKFYNKNTRIIDDIDYDLGQMCNSFNMHLLTSIEVLNREIKIAQEKNAISKKRVESIDDLKGTYHVEFKKLLRKLEFSTDIASKEAELDESYERIASFYGVKCEVTEGVRHLMHMKNKLSNNNAAELEDLQLIKEKLTKVNSIFMETRTKMRNHNLNSENHLAAFNECYEKLQNGISTVSSRWDHISTRGMMEEKIQFASRLLELLTFYWTEANFLDILQGKLSTFERMKAKKNPADVKKQILDLQMAIAMFIQQNEETIHVDHVRMPPRLSEAIIFQ
ncbi:hypothetical protein TVAG_168870 [Trichomonas vaginalis G3]|uniref:Uncharacterized protein n=1 Tax=Trichomonas vaginalis (strain ATCC PRA-98 / G3) TaxID=412133 RepID=A2GCF4_TRIV3|nr:hypothetical protein TVAGG3_0644060 [Trichomonas vaginalis G3]EAX85163.1 hypothetical protein TVAG_168870 [Trichomonas vaginalis G3]KAI5505377.1 hypothetical protein TVAGG3_0644060 [Trichomonas vaginalis G3]|eukprot:XP_001298093.1 hypothetical protein [Trichomonas vaginalis G3]